MVTYPLSLNRVGSGFRPASTLSYSAALFGMWFTHPDVVGANPLISECLDVVQTGAEQCAFVK